MSAIAKGKTEPNLSSQGEVEVPEQDVRAQLLRIMASPALAASPRRRKMLAYVVEQTLAGRGERLKAYDLALSVLDRGPDFDAQGDPIVRIEMGHLRRELEHHYLTAGRNDPIRIAIPKGHYVAVFEARGPEADVASIARVTNPTDAAAARWRWLAAGSILALTTAVITAWLVWPAAPSLQASGPAVIVVPFEPLVGGEDSRLLASGLTNALVIGLTRFDGLQVFAGAAAADQAAPLPAAAPGAPAYLVTGGVERITARLRITAALTERASGRVLWSQEYDRVVTAANVLDVEVEVANQIASHLAQGYGMVGNVATGQLAPSPSTIMFAND